MIFHDMAAHGITTRLQQREVNVLLCDSVRLRASHRIKRGVKQNVRQAYSGSKIVFDRTPY